MTGNALGSLQNLSQAVKAAVITETSNCRRCNFTVGMPNKNIGVQKGSKRICMRIHVDPSGNPFEIPFDIPGGIPKAPGGRNVLQRCLPYVSLFFVLWHALGPWGSLSFPFAISRSSRAPGEFNVLHQIAEQVG